MTDAVERWNPNQFKDKVEQRIKEAFVELIPEEAFKEMVSSAIDNFTTGRVYKAKDYHGREQEHYQASGLERIVEEILKKEVENRLREILQSPTWGKTYEGVMGDKLLELVTKATPAIIQMWVTDLVTSTLEAARSRY